MEDVVGWLSELKETAQGAISAAAGWLASTSVEAKWKKVAIFVGVALAMVIILNLIAN